MGLIQLQQVASKHLPSSGVPRVSLCSAQKSKAGPSQTAGLGTHLDVSRALSKGFELTLHGNTICVSRGTDAKGTGLSGCGLRTGDNTAATLLTGDLRVSCLSGRLGHALSTQG